MRVVKVSGHQLDDAEFLKGFCQAVAQFAADEQVVIINGGGKSIKALQEAFEIPEKKIQGLRVTDEKSLWITEMVMSAGVNKLLVRALQQAGLDALGISGVDGKVLTARKKVINDQLLVASDLGFVGEIIGVRTDLLKKLLDLGLTPVISPVSCDVAGQHYNINADEAATAVAQAMQADQLDFVSNVPGVLQDMADKQVIATLTPAEVDFLIEEGIVSGGMLPKVKAAVEALEKGVKQVRIVDMKGMTAGGTIFNN
ncbi:MAG: acetylglutamate kinase [Cellvibrionaceae bacterium]|jgi:acetylglutamate kinase